MGEPVTTSKTSAAVALSDATVAFRLAEGRVYTAVEKANLSVAAGEFVAIVGPTGCGKSTLLNVAAGLLAPAAGHVRIFESPLSGLNRQAGYLFQADALFPWKTAIENVAIGLETAGTPSISSAIATLSIAVFQGNSASAWKRYPAWRLRPERGLSKIRTWPAAGASSPAAMFSKVDLPQPVGPTMATNSPAATDRLAFSTAV